MRTVTYKADESLKKAVIPLGFVGENEHTRVVFKCAHIYKEYPSAVASISIRPPVGNEYPGIVVHDGDVVYWDITSADVAHRGLGEVQLTFTQGTKICKTYTAGTFVEKSIMGTGPVPVPLSDFIARASAAVTAIPETINAALEAAKESGEFNGEDGFSPILSVETILGGHRLTVTDDEGTFYVDIMNGVNGQDGFAPTVTVTDIDTGHRVTITDKYGAHTFDVLDGEGLTSFNYNNLYNKPTIGGVEVTGARSPSDYGAAELDGTGKVKSAQLPSYVDDVEEYASLSEFPATGESGKIYIALDTNLTYRWGGSTYVLISSALALGETSDTAYRGDRGKYAYDKAVAFETSKADKADTVLDTTLSRGRTANSTVGEGSIAFGNSVRATGKYAIATGSGTDARGLNETVIGSYNFPSYDYPDWLPDCVYQKGAKVLHTPNASTTPKKAYRANAEHTSGSTFDATKWDEIPGTSEDAFMIGNGTDSGHISRAMTVKWDGTATFMGNVYVQAGAIGDPADGKRLARIDELPVLNVASVAETQMIISSYSGDVGEVYETTRYYDETEQVYYYETSVDADDIAAIFTGGGNVLVHLTDDSENYTYLGYGEVYLQMVGYIPEYESGPNTIPAEFIFADPNGYLINSMTIGISGTGVSEDGKLRLYVTAVG